ncbi:MAG: hypothetical protein QX196_16195 [Methylococcaceae bacterium]|jgi:hypothetical protein
MRLINTRSDLDAIAGTAEYDAFINILKGSIYRLERDEIAKKWQIITDVATLEKFGFTLADFNDVALPEVPEFIASAANEQSIINAKSLAYLISTDWYVIRMAENGTPIPIDVLTKREEARLAIL